MEIVRIEAKQKLDQTKSPEDRALAAERLEALGNTALARRMTTID
jgi:predicted FMN-binding regulatory protein PaiB